MSSLIPELAPADLQQMSLGLSHSLSHHKLKFSPDKIDTMVVQAIGLLDDLDKELNTYAMRVREWFGWHFPEMTKIVSDNIAYAKVVRAASAPPPKAPAPACPATLAGLYRACASCAARGL